YLQCAWQIFVNGSVLPRDQIVEPFRADIVGFCLFKLRFRSLRRLVCFVVHALVIPPVMAHLTENLCVFDFDTSSPIGKYSGAASGSCASCPAGKFTASTGCVLLERFRSYMRRTCFVLVIARSHAQIVRPD